eukprot:785221-Prymnesium_polylepis.1
MCFAPSFLRSPSGVPLRGSRNQSTAGMQPNAKNVTWETPARLDQSLRRRAVCGTVGVSAITKSQPTWNLGR